MIGRANDAKARAPLANAGAAAARARTEAAGRAAGAAAGRAAAAARGRSQEERAPSFVKAAAPFTTVDTPWHFTVAWDAAPGATKAELDEATLAVRPLAAPELPTESFDITPAQVDGTTVWDFPVPSGLRVRQLHVALTDGDGNAVTDPPGDGSWRLTLSLPDPRGGYGAPLFAVPAIDGHGVVPASLTGASFAGGIVTLPDVAAPSLRVALVHADPSDFSAVGGIDIGKVTGTGVRYPAGLRVTDDKGAVLWASPRELSPGLAALAIDVKASLQKALNDRLKAAPGEPISLAFTLSTTGTARLQVRGPTVNGALVRGFPGVTRATLTGDSVAVAPPLAAGDEALAVDATAVVTADVTLRYDGLRVLPFSDAAPAKDAIRGRVVGGEPVLRALPPDALKDARVGRIGLIGRAPEKCELSVRFVRPLTGEPLPGDPAVVRLEPSIAITTLWFELPRPMLVGEPVAVAARATRGRFFWTTTDRDEPRVRVAVLDPKPVERVLHLGGVALSDEPAHRANADVTAHFASASPLFEGALFYTLDLGDLTLRYRR